jgi:hypothetical protein
MYAGYSISRYIFMNCTSEFCHWKVSCICLEQRDVYMMREHTTEASELPERFQQDSRL